MTAGSARSAARSLLSGPLPTTRSCHSSRAIDLAHRTRQKVEALVRQQSTEAEQPQRSGMRTRRQRRRSEHEWRMGDDEQRVRIHRALLSETRGDISAQRDNGGGAADQTPLQEHEQRHRHRRDAGRRRARSRPRARRSAAVRRAAAGRAARAWHRSPGRDAAPPAAGRAGQRSAVPAATARQDR